MKFADPQPLSGPVDVTLPHGFTGDVEQLRADLAAMGLDVRGVERAPPPPADDEPRVTLTSGPGAEGAEAMRAAGDATESLAALGNVAREGTAEVRGLAEQLARLPPDSHLAAAIAARVRMPAPTVAEERTARRKWERAKLGCCPCGEARGEDVCPWCDLGLVKGPDDIARDEQRRAERLAAIAEMMAELRPKPKAEPAGATRPPNRHERRRAASRRWRG